MIYSIKLDNDLLEHWVWQNAERLKWWLDLLFLAKPEKMQCCYKKRMVQLGKGQLCASLADLQKRWKKSVPTVLSFLTHLQQSGMITRKTLCNQTTVITICNYEEYIVPLQRNLKSESVNKEGQNASQLSLFEDTPPKTAKESKHKYKPLVLLTEKEFSKLVDTYGEDGTQWMIRKLDDYKASRGMTYKSDYRAILNWVVKEYEKEKASEISKQGNKAQRRILEVTATSAEDFKTTF